MSPIEQSGWTVVLFLSLTVCMGCGGGGAGGGGTSTPEQTYTIGGTVTGLMTVNDGAEALFLSNGNDVLIISANGSFTFTQPVGSGATYDVAVTAEPSDPVQFCMVSSGKGTALANVIDVHVTCTTASEQTLYDFGQQPDGSSPTGTLVFDKAGNLYGVTELGGGHQEGTVFMLTPGNGQWAETILYSYCPIQGCADGEQPAAGLTWDAAGDLYGSTNIRRDLRLRRRVQAVTQRRGKLDANRNAQFWRRTGRL